MEADMQEIDKRLMKREKNVLLRPDTWQKYGEGKLGRKSLISGSALRSLQERGPPRADTCLSGSDKLPWAHGS